MARPQFPRFQWVRIGSVNEFQALPGSLRTASTPVMNP